MSVVNTQEDVLPTCIVRKLMLSVAQKTKNVSYNIIILNGASPCLADLQKNREVVSREVTQFCFTGWPDMGVPDDASSMLKFVCRVRSAVTSEDGPIVVHCR